MTDTPPNDHDQNNDEDSQSFIPETREALRNHLRKLQHHIQTDISAEMAKKAEGAFNVGKPEHFVGAQGIDSPVSLVVYPQDPFVSAPEIRELPKADVQPGLTNSRIRIRDSQHPVAQPDDDNNYLYWTDTPQFNQVNAFYYATITLRMCEKFVNRPIPWAFRSPHLKIDPHAGYGMNAYYHEKDRQLGFFSFKFGEENMLNTAQSADVVSHETAHAVLDGLRDLYNQSFGLGPLAFHESFGDMIAVLVALQDDSLVQRLLEWTEGDLRMANFVSEVAEHVIQLLQELEEMEAINERTVYLRNAFNMFHYKPFDDLPYFSDNPSHKLGRESHNYSRLFTGAFYDLLVEIYEYVRQGDDIKPRIAIHKARDIAGHLLMYAVELGPVGELTFSDMARAFLTADVLLNDGEHLDLLIDIFAQRKILSESDARTHLERRRQLPEITLPDHVDSSLDSGIFLAEVVAPALNLPDVEFTPMNAQTNQRGYTFFTYFTTEEITLRGTEYKQFNGSRLEVFGGLTLAFDPDGHLVSVEYRPVNDEDIRQIRLLTTELVKYGMVAEQENGNGLIRAEYTSPTGRPSVQTHLLHLRNTPLPGQPDEGPRLVRVPIIMDSFPLHEENFATYLKQWQTQGETD